MLVVLRITIGWHFLYQGVWKLNEPEFSADSFLLQAKGPFAAQFRSLVPDADGRERLQGDKERLAAWEAYRKAFAEHHALTPDRQDETKKVLARRSAELKEYQDSIKAELDAWLLSHKQLEEWEAQPSAGVEFSRKRAWDRRQELTKQAKPWLDGIAAIELKYHEDLDRVLLPAELGKPLPPAMSGFERMNLFVVWTNIAIGVCLIAGLFTPLAAWGGAAFLLLIVLAQPAWPTIYPPPHPSAGQALIVNKEFVEMIALMALGTLPVGRWGGLDFFLHCLFSRTPTASAKS